MDVSWCLKKGNKSRTCSEPWLTRCVGLSLGEEGRIEVPPLNTDIRFGLASTKKIRRRGKNGLPDRFSWGHASESDVLSIREKKEKMCPVFNQYGCGSCWAVSVATSVSDCLVVSGSVDYGPSLSPTFCMSHYPQHQCQGGIPLRLLQDIERWGVADTSCVDYAWCKNDPSCTGLSGEGHFDARTDLSVKLPGPGCYYPGWQAVYGIDPGSISPLALRGSEVEAFRQEVRHHIFHHGPVLGGFMVMENFINGAFCGRNGGIYLEKVDNYDEDELTFVDEVDRSRVVGLHAVSVMGWGVTPSVQTGENSWQDVPYWICRNSWGRNWGDGGYFKMAMYPFNRLIQFDRQIRTVGRGVMGGFLSFRASRHPRLKKIKSMPVKDYRRIVRQKSSSSSVVGRSPSSSTWIFSAMFLLFLFFFLRFFQLR